MPLAIKTRADDADKHEYDITALIFHNGKLFSGSDDGKIKVWEEDLKLVGQVQAHPCSIFSLAVGNDVIYSCSNDGSVKAWTLNDLNEKGTIIKEENEMWKVCFNDGKLYVGDDAGLVKIFSNDKMVGILEIMHPITDMLAINNVVYTARDLYVIISEVYPEEKRFVTLQAIQGRAPVCVVGDKLCFASRSGRDICLHNNSKDTEFAAAGGMKDAHEMILNALCGVVEDNNNYVLSGGWDKVMKRWKIEESSIKLVDSCTVDMAITSITCGPNGEFYVGGGDGQIVRIDVQ